MFHHLFSSLAKFEYFQHFNVLLILWFGKAATSPIKKFLPLYSLKIGVIFELKLHNPFEPQKFYRILFFYSVKKVPGFYYKIIIIFIFQWITLPAQSITYSYNPLIGYFADCSSTETVYAIFFCPVYFVLYIFFIC